MEDVKKEIVKRIKDCRETLKGDLGILDTKTDPMQTKSFQRGKLAGLVIALDIVKELEDKKV